MNIISLVALKRLESLWTFPKNGTASRRMRHLRGICGLMTRVCHFVQPRRNSSQRRRGCSSIGLPGVGATSSTASTLASKPSVQGFAVAGGAKGELLLKSASLGHMMIGKCRRSTPNHDHPHPQRLKSGDRSEAGIDGSGARGRSSSWRGHLARAKRIRRAGETPTPHIFFSAFRVAPARRGAGLRCGGPHRPRANGCHIAAGDAPVLSLRGRRLELSREPGQRPRCPCHI